LVVPLNREVNRVVGRSLATHKPTSTHFKTTYQQQGSASQGVDGLTVPGYTGAIGGDSSPIPCGAEPLNIWKTILKNPDTGKITIDQNLVQYYLEHEATSPSTLNLPALQKNGRMCGSQCLIGQDEDGNRIAKRIVCGREWCQDCRDISHRRRIARVLTRLFQIDSMAYEVTTFPLEVRLMMRDPRVLTLLAKRYRKLLRKLGHRKIFVRWHYFGDKSHRFNPHLNALLDGGYLSPEQLEARKDLIRRRLLPRSIAKSIGKDLVIHYDWTRKAKRKMSWIKYVTRATFKDVEWDGQLASRLYGFHNGCFAGFWNDPPKWKLTGTDKKFNALLPLAEGKHPISGKPIVWNRRPIPFVLVLMEEPVDIGGGYYLLPPIREPPAGRRQPTNYASRSHQPIFEAPKRPTAIGERSSLQKA